MNSTQRDPGSKSNRATFLVLGLMGAIGFALIIVSTHWGAAASDDTFRYVAAARGLVNGHGLAWPTTEAWIPLTGYPPLVSLTLALFEFVGIDALQGARFMNAGLFALTVFLTGALVSKVTKSPGFGFVSAGLVLSSKVLLEAYAAAMSEALYITTTVLCLVLFISYLMNNKITTLIGLSLVAGLAFLTRYSGVSIVAALGFALLTHPQVIWRRKLKIFSIFSIFSLLPMALWIVRNIHLIGRATNRSMGWHMPALGWFEAGMRTILLWFVPGRLIQDHVVLYFVLFLAILIALATIAVLINRFRGPLFSAEYANGVLVCLGSYIFLSLITLFLARSLVATPVPLDDRLMAPVHHAVLILLVIVLGAAWFLCSRTLRFVIILFCIALPLFYVYRAIPAVENMREQGLGYTSRGWHNSQLLEKLEAYPDLPIYSNAAAAIYLWTGRVTDPLLPPEQLWPNIKGDCAIVVAFDSIDLGLYRISHEALAQELIGQKMNDGWLYQSPQCGME